MECYCYLRNIQDLLSDGKTPHDRRFGIPFTRPVIPFGAMVEYHPLRRTYRDYINWAQKSSQVYSSVMTWKGDLMVADMEELEEMDASEIHARRLNAKEVLKPMKGDNFIFPVADGTVKTPGRDRRLRPSTLIRDRPEWGEEQEVFRRESYGLSSPNPLQNDSTLDEAEAKNDFWSTTGDFIYRHHMEPRVKLYMPKEESFPIPLKYIEVTRTTHTSLDIFVGRTCWWLQQRGWRKRIMRCMDWIHKIYFIERKTTWRISWCGERLTRKQPQDPTMYGQICGSMWLIQRKAKRGKSGLSRTEAR